MASLNNVVMIGRLVRDPEKYQTSSGISYTRFTIAINRKYSRDTADFIPIVAWRQTSEYVSKYIKKGALVSIEGSLTSSTYKNKQNEFVTRYEVSADSVSSLEKRSNTDNNYKKPTDNKKMTFSKDTEKPTVEDEENDIPWDIEL